MSAEKLTPSFGADTKCSFWSDEDVSISDIRRVDLLSTGLVVASNKWLHETVTFNQVWLRRYLRTEVDLHEIVAVDRKSGLKMYKKTASDIKLENIRTARM